MVCTYFIDHKRRTGGGGGGGETPGHRADLECEILINPLALYGKNYVKIRWCPLGQSRSAASVVDG